MTILKQLAAMLGLCGMVAFSALGATPEVNIADGPIFVCRGSGGFRVAMSGVSLSNSNISTGDGFVYQAGFDVSKWSGSLRKLRLVRDDVAAIFKQAAVADWDAGEVLTGMNGQPANPAPDARKLYTAKLNADRTVTTVQLKWEQLPADQKLLLNTYPPNGKDDGLGEQRLNFLRGVRSMELGQPGGIFRARDRVLGDIINSNPVYVGAPARDIQGADYQKFFDKNNGRTAAVYVGANDGLLHGFSAIDGKELFAYAPNALIQAMTQLSMPGYVHRPYVDGALSVSEARVGSSWKTILTSGMGGGAQGLFALDVTDPSNFGAGLGVVMEFTDKDDADMGNLVGAPVIAKFKMKITHGVPEFGDFIVAAGGLNSYKDDGSFDAAAPGTLFLLSLDKAPTEKWKLGVNYYKFKTPIQDTSLQNGLASPALVVGSDGAVRFAYAGDLQGNLWRLDFTGSAPWSRAVSSQPLFTAMDAGNLRQPITAQPKAVFAPDGGNLLLFGTGKLVEYSDTAQANFKTQSFYGIYDSTKEGDRVSGRSQLAARTLQKITFNGADALAASGPEFSYGASGQNKKGWYFDFLDSDKTGERSVTGAMTAFGSLFFNTLIPGGDPCVAGGGRTYVLDVLTGLPSYGQASGFLSEVGLMSAPLLLETAMPEVGDRNAIGKRRVKRKFTVINFGTGGTKGKASSSQESNNEASVPAGRLSWREILNWQELRDAIAKK